jgi:Na+-driven multidrug efflux pump
MATYAGQNLGAGKIGRIRQGIRTANTIGMFTSAAIGGIMILFGKHILGLFLSGDPQEVAQAMDVAYVYLCIMSVSLPLLYYLHVTRSTVQGMGNTLLPMVSGVLEFFMRTGTALLAPMLMGEFGIFFAETMAWMGADVVLTASYFLTIKKAQRQNDP